MYQGKYPESGLPPGYNGTLYEHAAPPPHEPPHDEGPNSPYDEKSDFPNSQRGSSPHDEWHEPPRDEWREPPHDEWHGPPHDEKHEPPCSQSPSPPLSGGMHNVIKGISEHLFSHSINMEDLLIIGLTVMLINSGADTSLIIAMAMLFVMGL